MQNKQNGFSLLLYLHRTRASPLSRYIANILHTRSGRRWRRRRFAGAERGSSNGQIVPDRFCEWVRAAKHAPRDWFYFRERPNGFAEIVECGGGVSAERFRRLDRDRDRLLVFFVCIILFCVAAAVYFLTHLLVAAAPVVMLASGVAVAQFASNTTRRVVGQWGGAGGACCEDHIALVWLL